MVNLSLDCSGLYLQAAFCFSQCPQGPVLLISSAEGKIAVVMADMGIGSVQQVTFSQDPISRFVILENCKGMFTLLINVQWIDFFLSFFPVHHRQPESWR